VVVALLAAIVTLIALNFRRLPALRSTMDAGANASVLPGGDRREPGRLRRGGRRAAGLRRGARLGAWRSMAGRWSRWRSPTNVLAALTGSASGGLTIALDALGATYLQLATEQGIDPALMHRVAVIGAGTLDSLPHNGAVVTLLAVCGATHRAAISTSSWWRSSAPLSAWSR
jgi:hypothetical protein